MNWLHTTQIRPRHWYLNENVPATTQALTMDYTIYILLAQDRGIAQLGLDKACERS